MGHQARPKADIKPDCRLDEDRPHELCVQSSPFDIVRKRIAGVSAVNAVTPEIQAGFGENRMARLPGGDGLKCIVDQHTTATAHSKHIAYSNRD
jgi:hypothetical protein